MALVLLFLAVAVFSPLHQHAADGSCTLNGFEFIVQAEHQSVLPQWTLTQLCWHRPPHLLLTVSRSAPACPLLRGPPALA